MTHESKKQIFGIEPSNGTLHDITEEYEINEKTQMAEYTPDQIIDYPDQPKEEERAAYSAILTKSRPD